jgi:hypothetical protein
MSEQPILRVNNHHTDACGAPPAIDDSEPNRYLGYFENEHGEQAIFVYDRTRRAATLLLAMLDGSVRTRSWKERLQASSSEQPSGPGWPRAGRRPRVLDPIGEILERPALAQGSTGRLMTGWPSSRRSGRPSSRATSRSVPDGTDDLIDSSAVAIGKPLRKQDEVPGRVAVDLCCARAASPPAGSPAYFAKMHGREEAEIQGGEPAPSPGPSGPHQVARAGRG